MLLACPTQSWTWSQSVPMTTIPGVAETNFLDRAYGNYFFLDRNTAATIWIMMNPPKSDNDSKWNLKLVDISQVCVSSRFPDEA